MSLPNYSPARGPVPDDDGAARPERAAPLRGCAPARADGRPARVSRTLRSCARLGAARRRSVTVPGTSSRSRCLSVVSTVSRSFCLVFFQRSAARAAGLRVQCGGDGGGGMSAGGGRDAHLHGEVLVRMALCVDGVGGTGEAGASVFVLTVARFGDAVVVVVMGSMGLSSKTFDGTSDSVSVVNNQDHVIAPSSIVRCYLLFQYELAYFGQHVASRELGGLPRLISSTRGSCTIRLPR